MLRLLCTALIAAAALYAQVSARIVTILPAPDRSATGRIDFQDKSSVKKGTLQMSDSAIVSLLDDASVSAFDVDLPNKVASVNGIAAQAALNVNNGWIYSSGGLVTDVHSWQAINSNTDGGLLRGFHIGQNTTNTKGGYIALAPVTYNPYNSGTTCYDEWGNIVTQPLPLDGLSAFGAHDTIMWVSTSPTMDGHCGASLNVDLDYGLNINSYFFARGGLATDVVAYNSIQSLKGGAYLALGLTADQGVYLANHASSSTLNPLAAGYGGIAHKSGTQYWLWNDTTSAWSSVDLAASSPGGADTQVQFNNAGSFGGSSNLIWNNSSKLLQVTTLTSGVAGMTVQNGYMQADGGFLASSGVATLYNAIQAPSGGLYGKSLTALNYIQTGHSAGTPTPTSGDSFHAGAFYWDDTAGAAKIYNGSSWTSLSGGSVAGSDTQVQFNNAGAFGASSNLTWNNSSKVLTITASSSSAAGVAVGTGFVQADAGFLATSGTATNYNAIQAPGGGVYAKSLTALYYVDIGESYGAPTMTYGDTLRAGKLYWDASVSAPKIYNGSSWTTLATGGVTSLNGQIGSMLISGWSNQINVGTIGTTIQLTTPQDIGTSSNVQFGSVTTSGTITAGGGYKVGTGTVYTGMASVVISIPGASIIYGASCPSNQYAFVGGILVGCS